MKTAKKVVRTKKKNVQILIPEISEYVVQPNHVTNARYEYSLLQERVFTGLMYKLQDDIKNKLNHRQSKQPNLFFNEMEKDDDNLIKVSIPLKDIAAKSKYKIAVEDAEKMGNISVSFPPVVKGNIVERTTVFLLNKVETRTVNGRLKDIDVYVNRDVAELLTNLISNRIGQPSEYTRFMYQIAQEASSKYTSLLYKKICSWRKKGGFTILLEDLYKDVCVNKVYLNKNGSINYKNFKSKVLEKAKSELFQKADCWFEYKENYRGRSVYSLSFKIITPETIEHEENLKENIKVMMVRHLGIESDEINKYFSDLFTDENFNYTRIYQKLVDIHDYIHNLRTKGKMVDAKAYAMRSLQNFVSELNF